jgi:circadian clock protein KaiB
MIVPGKNTKSLDGAVAGAPYIGSWQFRLYVAGSSPNSQLAAANLKALGDRYLAGNYTIEIVDVLKEPLRTLNDRVYVTPTLVRLFPEPVCRIIGNLSDLKPILAVLGLKEASNG